MDSRKGSGSRGGVRVRTSAFGSLSSVAVVEKKGGDMGHGFGEESEKSGAIFESETESVRPVWIEVADKVRREYGFGSGAQPAKFLQVFIVVLSNWILFMG